MDGAIASAVMLPEPDEADQAQPSPASPGGQKRRLSSVAVTDQDQKRQRVSSVDANTHPDRRSSVNGKNTATTTAPAVPARRERGRERRLFGAALGALSQNSATAAQRKRAEVEKRQRERRVQEVQEDDQRKSERAAQRKAQRQKEQKRFEQDSIRIRHANLRSMAHFLQTNAEPRLYYKPWETTPDEDDIIRDQIAEAEDLIRHELGDAAPRHDMVEARERHVSRDMDAEGDAGAERPIGKELPAEDAPPQLPPPNEATNHSPPSPKDPGPDEDHAEETTKQAVSGEQAAEPEQQDKPTSPSVDVAEEDASKDVPDDNGEEVVEAAEDTVIY